MIRGLSKYVHRSLKVNSIEATLLEKRLILNHAKIMEEVNARAKSDLESCYYRKTLDLCGSAEEK